MEAVSDISAVMAEKMEPLTEPMSSLLGGGGVTGKEVVLQVRNDPRLLQTQAAKLQAFSRMLPLLSPCGDVVRLFVFWTHDSVS